MITALKALSAMLIVFGICYLLGCFYSLSFDISQWSDDTRGVVCLIGGLFSALCGMMVVAVEEKL